MKSLFLALFSMVIFAASAQANLLDDGSFEAATDNTTTSNSAWVLNADAPDGTDDSARFSASVWAASDGQVGAWFKPFEGNQSPGDPTANADLSQTVSNVAAGGTYSLSFVSARETNATAGSIVATLSSTSAGSTSIDLLSATYNDGGNMGSNPTSFTLSLPGVLAGDDVTVSVAMVDGVDSLANPQSIMFDNFDLTVIPEPASIVLAGMSMLGLLSLRRRR